MDRPVERPRSGSIYGVSKVVQDARIEIGDKLYADAVRVAVCSLKIVVVCV